MARYLIQGSYTAAGAKGILAEGGSKRRAAVDEMVKGLGGSVESFYFALGEEDVCVIVEAPSNVDVAAVSLAVGASGAVRLRTTALLTPEEMDEAAKKSVAYRPPGA